MLRRRVGDDYFRQLARQYRAALSLAQRRPALGRAATSPAFLDDYLAGGEYAWLADLARLEWSRAECLDDRRNCHHWVSTPSRAYPSEALEHLVFGLQPSLQLHASAYPVFTVWLANQVENAPPVDQSMGSETGYGPHARTISSRSASSIPPRFLSFPPSPAARTLGDAMTSRIPRRARADHVLAFLFSEGIVSSLTLSSERMSRTQ